LELLQQLSHSGPLVVVAESNRTLDLAMRSGRK
jgi:hypothetical protein